MFLSLKLKADGGPFQLATKAGVRTTAYGVKNYPPAESPEGNYRERQRESKKQTNPYGNPRYK